MIRKKLTALVCSVSVLTAICSLNASAAWNGYYGNEIAEEEKQESIYGDVNLDNVVDSFDLIRLRSHLSGSELTGEALKNADLDQNDSVNEYDMSILSDFLLTGNTGNYVPVGSVRLTPNVDIRSDGPVNDTFSEAQMKFSIDLMKNTFNKDSDPSNLLISPLSVNAALAMTANGAAGDTLTEFTDLLAGGESLDTFNQYIADTFKRLTSDKNVTIDIMNSVWYRNQGDFAIDVKKPFLNTVAEYMGADAFATPFNSRSVKDINHWVAAGTHNIIPFLYDNNHVFSDNDVMLLINTLYFDGEWDMKYERSFPDNFTAYDGTQVRADFLFDQERYYIEGDGYTGFRKDYSGHNFSFVGILPDEGTDIYDFVQGIDPSELLKSVNDPVDVSKAEEYTILSTSMPKIKYSNSMSLKDTLISMGLQKSCYPGLADFSGMTDTMELYISEVIHKTAIDVNESGTTAAAVTAVMLAGNAMPNKVYEVHLDRPYVYMIMDNHTGLPLFIGAVTDVPETTAG